MGTNKNGIRYSALFLSGLLLSGGASAGFNSAQNAEYKRRPGWQPIVILSTDDCQTWKSKGKSLIDWSGEICGPDGLIKAINKKPENIPAFYAAYHEYGTGGVRAIDVRDNSQLNYLNFVNDLAKKLSSSAVVLKIYDDYIIDRKPMGLAEVSRENFVKQLNELSLKQPVIYQKMNDVAKADYEKSSNVHSNEKLGVNYKTVCGPYTIDLSSADGWARINGAKPETQKISPIGSGGSTKGEPDNIKMEWMAATNQPGRWVGLEYIKRNGKAILNAQWLQASIDAPRQYATYDCVKIK